MAKDPAFLFYSSDFLTGTILMSDEQIGKYIRLLCIQHQKGHLSEKDMLSICKAHDEHIFSKFTKDSGGLFYNERLETESVKRFNYTESRRQNALKKPFISEKHMDEHMENENENENIKEKKAKNLKRTPKVSLSERNKEEFLIEILAEFKANGYLSSAETQAKRFYATYQSKGWRDIIDWKPLVQTWEEFKTGGSDVSDRDKENEKLILKPGDYDRLFTE